MALSKEKLTRLLKYKQLVKDRLAELAHLVPAKHVGHPKEFKQFLERELDAVTKKLEADKLA